MGTCLPIAVGIFIMPALAWSTTLRLTPEIDLLVLDGKKVSSSLLKGADSIELDNGPHQLVLRVEKKAIPVLRDTPRGLTLPRVISFDTKAIEQVNILLSDINSRNAAQITRITLLDGNAKHIPVKEDILALNTSSASTDHEEETRQYNSLGKRASMPIFARLSTCHQGSASGSSQCLTHSPWQAGLARAKHPTVHISVPEER